MKRTASILVAALAAITLAAFPASGDEKKGNADKEKKGESKMQKTPSGLQYEDVKVGTGAEPKRARPA